MPVERRPVGATSGAPAEYPPASPAGQGMFGIQGTGDTSGFGGLVRRRPGVGRHARGRSAATSTRSYDALEEAFPGFADAIEKVVVDRGELTLHIVPERIAEVCQVMRDDEALRFELCSSVSGVDYLGADERRLHVVYHLTSMTYRRRVRLEAAVTGRAPAPAERHQRLPDRRLAGAGDVRHVRRHLRRPPQPDPDPHAGRLGGPPAAQGLPARRRAGRVQGRRDPAAGPAEGLPVTAPDTRPNARPPRARSSPSPAATGTPSSAAPTRSTTSGSSSTWVRSTRPRTACCGWCWSSRARRSPSAGSVVGYLHTGIEKNLEYRNWMQGTTFVTRMDYLAPMFNETGYCLAVEKLLGIEDQITERATTIRVLMMELNRISSHLVWLATTGMELGAISMMLYGFREREYILDIFEMVTGLRMNMAYVRPGGVAQDVPRRRRSRKIREFLDLHAEEAQGVRGPALRPADLAGAHQGRRGARRDRLPGAGHHRPGAALGRPGLGPAQDRCRTAATRRTSSTCRPRPTADVWGRYQVRLAEMRESLKIVEQALDRLRARPDHGRRQEDRLAGAARHRRRTAWATRSSTSRRSWASRWSR